MRVFYMILWLCAPFFVKAQGTLAENQLDGLLLYKSEMTSWYGTDVVREKFPGALKSLGGYFSYPSGNWYSCVFYSKDAQPKVLITISFDSTYQLQEAITNTETREFTAEELVYYKLRKAAFEQVKQDTSVHLLPNTSLNFVPLVHEGKHKVYVLSGPKEPNIVLFGNDYLLLFDDKTHIKSLTKLHKQAVPIKYDDKQPVAASLHTDTNESDKYITATDICTLMLYARYAGWKQHFVVSPSFVSIWDCEKDELNVITIEAWHKILEAQQQK
ncbi:hypothetical protein LX64_01368 [Chitinophaga skermanii]|uniref:Uncharacterized protein n=1 Tax=Chitinophaga skermanii TaxID=331697 RepID=A0A327QYB7_9BACT|nr:hypothetical protein [Chitinophaga skermanii]RAJ08714.1 hypothetical protein LX64_01368 [Chitinophaga skermanii]